MRAGSCARMEVPSFDRFHSVFSRLLNRDLADRDEAKNEELEFGILEFHSRAIVDRAKLCWVVDVEGEYYVDLLYFPLLDDFLRWVSAIQASLIDWLKGGSPRRLLYSLCKTCMGGWVACNPPEEDPGSEASIPSYAVVVSALVLLSLVYQYLAGTVDVARSKAYSRSSLDFRDIYVAIVLFLGAYVWIKFRDVALKGAHKRTRVDKRGRTKVFYDARLTPPRWNGEALPKLELGQFATEQEAHNKFLIAAFYYNRDAGLLDGWFQVPPMSEEGRSLTGLELRAWVIDQAKKVYEDFRRKEAALLVQELLEDEVRPPEQDALNVANFSVASLLNSNEHQQPTLVSQVENLGTNMPDGQGLECTSHSFGGTHEGFVTSTDFDSLGFQEESALPLSHLPVPDTRSGMDMNISNQLNFPQIVRNQQELITYQQQRLQELGAQISVLQTQQRIHQQQLEESRVHISQLLECQHDFVQQQLQVINQGVPSLEAEMEPSMPPQNHPCRPHGSAFW